MKRHNNILINKHPVLWFKNKYFAGLSKSNLGVASVTPFIFGLIGLLADFTALNLIVTDNISHVLAYMLFGYGILNIIFAIELIRIGGRLQNERVFYKVMHKNVIEPLREYRTHKKNKSEIGELEHFMHETLKKILDSFNANYMQKKYSQKVVATLKYKLNDRLIPIRSGDEADYRDKSPEEADKSFVYKALSDIGEKLPYIYVKDLDEPDTYECQSMGKFTEQIKNRAGENYKTFIALPIRGGRLPVEAEVRRDLGILGFDLKEKFRFGNFEEHELDYIACLADSLSEIITDLVSIKKT